MKILLLSTIIIFHLSLFPFHSSAQYQDTIFLKSGKIIPCKIINQNDNGVWYNYINEDGGLEHEYMTIGQSAEIIFKDDTSWDTDKLKKIELYRTKVCTSICSKGILYQTLDSEISFLDNYRIKDSHLFDIKNKVSNGDIQPIKIPVNSISKLVINPSTGKGAAIGAGIGLLTGIIAGIAVGDQGFVSKYFFAGGFGAGLAVCGAIVGGIVGASIQIKIPINGDQKIYKEHRDMISKYSVTGR